MLHVFARLSGGSPYADQFWAYLTLAVSSIVTEERSPLIGGLAAHDGHLRFVLVVLALTAGTWVAGMILYYLGRWQSKLPQIPWPRLRRLIVRALHVVRSHPWRSSLAVRFAYGLRLALPLACGAARLPVGRYSAGR